MIALRLSSGRPLKSWADASVIAAPKPCIFWKRFDVIDGDRLVAGRRPNQLLVGLRSELLRFVGGGQPHSS